MKTKFLLTFLLTGVSLSLAEASTIVYDPYRVSGPGSYTPDVSLSNPINQNQPAAEGAWTGPVNGFTTYVVSSNGLTYDGLATTGGSLLSTPGGSNSRAFSATNLSETVYYGFLIRFSDFQNNVLIGLGDSSGGIASSFWVGAGGVNMARTTNNYSAEGTPLELNTTYLIVGKYSHSGPLSYTSLWIDPTLGTGEPGVPTLLAEGLAGPGAAQWYSLLNGSIAYQFDEFRVGTTWDSVTLAAVPEPSTVVLLVGALTAVGTWRWRRSALTAKR